MLAGNISVDISRKVHPNRTSFSLSAPTGDPSREAKGLLCEGQGEVLNPINHEPHQTCETVGSMSPVNAQGFVEGDGCFAAASFKPSAVARLLLASAKSGFSLKASRY
jgi:hypothetical protein